MRVYFRIFLVAGVPFGFIFGSIAGLLLGLKAGLTIGSLAGSFFGFFMSVYLGKIQHSATKSIKATSDLSPHQTKTIHLSVPREDAAERCHIALQKLGAINVTASDNGAQIRAQTKMTWKSYGEKIEIRLKALERSKTEINVSSLPKQRLTVFDYGKGYQNVSDLVELLSDSHIGSSGAD